MEYMKLIYEVDNSKCLPLAVKNLILDQIKFENVKNIHKLGVLLGGDIWERTELEEDVK